jgi:hypothetical protein
VAFAHEISALKKGGEADHIERFWASLNHDGQKSWRQYTTMSQSGQHVILTPQIRFMLRTQRVVLYATPTKSVIAVQQLRQEQNVYEVTSPKVLLALLGAACCRRQNREAITMALMTERKSDNQ